MQEILQVIPAETIAGFSKGNSEISAVRHTPLSIGRAALQALHQELSAYPKPGLVSPVDSGSHSDMDAATFFRSLFALRSYFREIALAGMQGMPFPVMQRLGFAAEQRMLRATQGVNTHRGAIFNLGLLAAAAGYLLQEKASSACGTLGQVVRDRWGEALLHHSASLPKTSHGSLVALRYGVGGAREEAAAGFPHVFEIGLPILVQTLRRGVDLHGATVQCLFSLMEVLPDSNVLYRGGEEGLRFTQAAAGRFLQEGGVHRPGWKEHAIEMHKEFVQRRLSPGGSADLLAASIFVHCLTAAERNPPRDKHVISKNDEPEKP